MLPQAGLHEGEAPPRYEETVTKTELYLIPPSHKHLEYCCIVFLSLFSHRYKSYI